MPNKKTPSKMTKLQGGMSFATVLDEFLRSIGRDIKDDCLIDSPELKIWSLPSDEEFKDPEKFTLVLVGKPDTNDCIFHLSNRIVEVPLIGTQDFLVWALEFAHNMAVMRLSIAGRYLCVGYCAPLLGIGGNDLRLLYEAIKEQESWLVENLTGMGADMTIDD